MNMNNRQTNRRRGRNNSGGGNNRPQQGNRGGFDSGNRIDSRARGNAAQMIEKYKNMARDAQLAGDRVQTEYYLQFADHYFRVMSDFRARQDEGRPQGERNQDRQRGADLDNYDDFDGMSASTADETRGEARDDRSDDRGGDMGDDGRDDNRSDNRPPRRDHPRRDDGRGEGRGDRGPRGDRGEARRDPRAEGDNDGDREALRRDGPGPRRGSRGEPRGRSFDADVSRDDDGAGIDLAVLPPAIGRNSDEPAVDADDSVAVKPRGALKPRRARKPVDDADGTPPAEAAE